MGRATGSHLRVEALGDNAQGVRLYGDRNRPEHAEFRVIFPGGDVSVCRTTEGDYWVHLRVDREGAAQWAVGDPEASIVAGRLDALSGTRVLLVPTDLYHVAMRVRMAPVAEAVASQ